MTNVTFQCIKRLIHQYDGLSDEAFLAVCSEFGVDADDLAEYVAEEERRRARRTGEGRRGLYG